MYKILLLTLIPGLVLAADQQVQSLINNGDYESAFNILQESADTSQNSEEMLFLLGETAPAGKYCSVYLKEYIQEFPQGAHIDQVKRQLANYYAAQGLNITASRMYPDTLEAVNIDPEEQYRLALYRQQAGEYESAIDIYTQLLVSADSEFADWARLGIADCNLLLGKYEMSIDGYKEIIGGSSPAAPFALLGISDAFRRQNKLDRAESYYKIYKQNYPSSPGSLELDASLSETPKSDGKIPTVIKAGYFIQVGVFSKKDNAKNCLRKFKLQGFQSRVEDYDEDGQRYYRVLIGPYQDEPSARRTKSDLERTQDEEFLIFVE